MLWKNIDDRYSVSELGNVMNVKTKRVLKSDVDPDGYCSVVLRQNGKSTHHLIHRLVAKAFIPNLENKPQVNHKNGIKMDNSVGNLEWVTDEENKCHALSFGLHNQKGKNNSRWRGGVQMLSLQGEFIKDFETTTVAASWLRKNTEWVKAQDNNIGKVCNGKAKRAYGHQWKYVS